MIKIKVNGKFFNINLKFPFIEQSYAVRLAFQLVPFRSSGIYVVPLFVLTFAKLYIQLKFKASPNFQSFLRNLSEVFRQNKAVSLHR